MSFKLKIITNLVQLKFTKWLYQNGVESVKRRRTYKFLKGLESSPFYEKKSSPLIPLQRGKLNGFLNQFPVINKTIFMQEFDRINTCGIKSEDAFRVALEAENSRDFSPMINGITVGLSTGTSGNRGIFLASESERAAWVAAILDRVIGFSLKKRKVAFFLRANSNLYQSTQSKLLQFHFFDLFRDLNEHVTRLNETQPNIIVAQPSMLCLLAAEKEAGTLKINPSKIISVAEVLSAEDKSFLEAVFTQTIHQVYQCTEGFLASTCKEGTLHFNEDFLIIEKKYINEEQTKFHPIVTDLFRTSQPIVRYELNDIITEKKSCACGSKFLAIEQIEGRSDDILVFTNSSGEEVKLFPDIFRRTIVLADEEITDYCLVQSEWNKLSLHVESQSETAFQKTVTQLEVLLKSYAVEGVTVERMQGNPFVVGNKKRRVRNESRKTN